MQEFKSKMNHTSAEPARTTAYSPDIGWRVVWQRLGMDLTFKQIAQRLQIAVGTAHRIFKRFMDMGDVSAIARKVGTTLTTLESLISIMKFTCCA